MYVTKIMSLGSSTKLNVHLNQRSIYPKMILFAKTNYSCFSKILKLFEESTEVNWLFETTAKQFILKHFQPFSTMQYHVD